VIAPLSSAEVSMLSKNKNKKLPEKANTKNFEICFLTS